MDNFDPVAFYKQQCGGIADEEMYADKPTLRALAAEVKKRTFARAAEICRCQDGLTTLDGTRDGGEVCAQAIEKEANK